MKNDTQKMNIKAVLETVDKAGLGVLYCALTAEQTHRCGELIFALEAHLAGEEEFGRGDIKMLRDVCRELCIDPATGKRE
ncbi:hypothetical protein [Thiomonas sp.]